MLHQMITQLLLAGEQAAAGVITGINTPFNVSCYKTGLFLCYAEAISADDTVDIDIYTLNPGNNKTFKLGSFDQITTAGNYLLKITENLGFSIYAVATVTGAAAVECSFTLHGIFQD